MTEPQAHFVNLRPPIRWADRPLLTRLSGGRLTWEGGFPRGDFGVSIWFVSDRTPGIATRIIFEANFPPHLSVERLQIGLPLDEVLRRYPALKLEVFEYEDMDEEDRRRWLARGFDDYIGAFTATGHEIMVRVRDGRVVQFRISCPGEQEAEDALRRQDFAIRKKVRLEMAARKRREQRFLASLTTTRAQDDVMLNQWAREHEDGPRLARFLKKATPDDWHAVATSWNWDNDLDPLFWIIRRPDCDKATVLWIFHLGEPDEFCEYAGRIADVPGMHLKHVWLASEIFDRWTRGFYTRSELAFAPVAGSPDQVLDRAGQVHPVPASMTGTLAGRVVSADGYEEGFPPLSKRRR